MTTHKLQKAKRFEELWIWQHARDLAREIDADFNGGPDSQDYGFRGQVQNAGISIMNNIAEGFERSSDPAFARFLDIAKGSCGEFRSMYYIAEDLAYIDSKFAEMRRSRVKQISAGISSLRTHLRKNNK